MHYLYPNLITLFMKIRTLTSVVFLGLAAIACKEKDLSEENPYVDPNNVEIGFSAVYGGNGFNPDSLITNIHGNDFFIDSIQLLTSNFYLVNRQDTLGPDPQYAFISSYNNTVRVARVEPGFYSGRLKLDIGLDSLENATNAPSNTSEDALKKAQDLYETKFGYYNIIIHGRLIDEDDATDSTGSIPLLYKLGGEEIVTTASSEFKNFAVDANKKAFFILYIDLKGALHYLNLKQRPLIESDPTNTQDYNAALTMLDSLDFQIF